MSDLLESTPISPMSTSEWNTAQQREAQQQPPNLIEKLQSERAALAFRINIVERVLKAIDEHPKPEELRKALDDYADWRF